MPVLVYPKLPRRLVGAGGWIKIRRVKHVSLDGEDCWGMWDQSKRQIDLERAAPLEHQWRVLWHEWAHSVLDDSGLSQLITRKMEEAFCEAFATARMVELRRMLTVEQRAPKVVVPVALAPDVPV